MKIPGKVERILASADILEIFEKFEKNDLEKAQNLIIITSQASGQISIRYAGLINALEVIGLLTEVTNIVINTKGDDDNG